MKEKGVRWREEKKKISGIFKVAVTAHLFPSISRFPFERKAGEKKIKKTERERAPKHHKSCTPDAARTLAEMYALTHVRDAQYTTTINR